MSSRMDVFSIQASSDIRFDGSRPSASPARYLLKRRISFSSRVFLIVNVALLVIVGVPLSSDGASLPSATPPSHSSRSINLFGLDDDSDSLGALGNVGMQPDPVTPTSSNSSTVEQQAAEARCHLRRNSLPVKLKLNDGSGITCTYMIHICLGACYSKLIPYYDPRYLGSKMQKTTHCCEAVPDRATRELVTETSIIPSECSDTEDPTQQAMEARRRNFFLPTRCRCKKRLSAGRQAPK